MQILSSVNQPDKILNKFTQHWLDHLESQLPKKYCYHRSEHTLMVMAAVKTMAVYMGFSKRAVRLMQVAALFHDMGYLHDHHGHEIKSAEYISQIAQELQLTSADVMAMSQMILHTHPSKRPTNLMQAILKDADLSYLGQPDAEKWSDLLRKEYVNLGKISSMEEFRDLEVSFLNQHQFNTQYAQIHFGPSKRLYMKKKELILV